MGEPTNFAPGAGLRDALSWLPVRLVLLFVTLTAVDIAFQIAPQLMMPKTPGPLRDAIELAGALVLSGAMIAAYRSLVRVTERRVADELQARNASTGLMLGIAGGAALFVLVYAILFASGAAALQGFGDFSGAGHALAIAIASAVGEEIVFRGVAFRILEECVGTTVALALSAVAFGLVHAGNHGATVVSTVAIAAESGLLLGLAYAATGKLWLPIGLHLGWNFTEGGIFGAAVSGGQYTGLIVAPLSGPRILTGGEFGPEASGVAAAVGLLASSALAWAALQRGRWRPARLSLKQSRT
jgi:uncharacterized protein